MDIVERLKMRAEFFREHKISNPDADMDDEAADEIERLREALKKISQMPPIYYRVGELQDVARDALKGDDK